MDYQGGVRGLVSNRQSREVLTSLNRRNKLGSFNVEIEIGDPSRGRWVVADALVGTGAFMTSVPASVLRSLSVEPTGKRRVRFGQGEIRELDYAQTWLRLDGQEIMTFILFNEESTTPLLGSYALEGLFMAVDPVAQQLVPLDEIHS